VVHDRGDVREHIEEARAAGGATNARSTLESGTP
jgi:hypothetical protein